MPIDPNLPPEPPTTPLATAPPVRRRMPAGAPVAEAPVVDGLFLDDLVGAVRSLRTALTVVALVAAAALILAFYALHEARKDNGPGASRARVARLDDRITRLSRQVQSLRGSTSSSDLQSLRRQVAGAATVKDLQTLSASVDKLSAQAAQGGSGAGDQQAAITDLTQRVDKLSAQVQALQQQSGTP